MKNKLLSSLAIVLVLIFGITLSACGAEKQNVEILILSSNINHGNVFGGGQFIEGDKVTLVATANKGSEFVAWIKNNRRVSDKENYEFNASIEGQGTYTAVFKSVTPTYYTPFAMAFFAKQKFLEGSEAPPVIVIDEVSLNFSSASFSTSNLINKQEKLDFLLEETFNSSMIYEFEQDVFLKVYSGSQHNQNYTLSFNINYTINQKSFQSSENKTISLLELQDGIDSYDMPYKYVSLTIEKNNVLFHGYAWFAPAGTQIETSILSSIMQ